MLITTATVWYSDTEQRDSSHVNYLKPPVLTTVQRNSMTLTWGWGDCGKMWYNSDLEQLEMFNGNTIVIVG